MSKLAIKIIGNIPSIICSKCKKVIKPFSEFNNDEKLALKNKKKLKAQYCAECEFKDI
jgi:hypothetical protein